MDEDVYASIVIGGGPEPAHLVCETRDDGHLIVCFISFAGRRLAATEMGIMRGQQWFREKDRATMSRMAWQRFWRYLGAA